VQPDTCLEFKPTARASAPRTPGAAAMSSANDPFYLVKEEIQESVNKVKALCDRVDRLPEGNGERVRYATSAKSECESVFWQLDELDRATAMAERDFARFKVDASELTSRKRWTAATKATASALCDKANGVIEARKRRGAGYHGGGGGDDDAASRQQQRAANDGYLEAQSDQQQTLLRRQDVDLDDISASISRIGQVGLTIGEELDTQGRMLDDLETDVEGTNSRLRCVLYTGPHTTAIAW